MLALLLLFVSRDGHVATGLLQRSLLGLQLSSWEHPSPPALCSSTCSRSFQSLQKEASVGGSEGWAHPRRGGPRWPWRHTHFSLCSAAPLLKMFCYSYTRIYYILMCFFKMCHSKLTAEGCASVPARQPGPHEKPGPLPFPFRCHQIKVSNWLPHPPKVAGDIKQDIDCEFGLAIMQS